MISEKYKKVKEFSEQGLEEYSFEKCSKNSEIHKDNSYYKRMRSLPPRYDTPLTKSFFTKVQDF